jgi:hypothetical protein
MTSEKTSPIDSSLNNGNGASPKDRRRFLLPSLDTFVIFGHCRSGS